MTTTIYTRQDDEIRDSVLDQLQREPDLNSSNVGVDVEDGIVTLTGFADSCAAKLAIERAAKRAFGVRAVANDIQITLSDEWNDTDIAQGCVAALRNRVTVPSQVKVTVRCGHVTLEGTVDSIHQRMAAEDAVTSLRGVKSVSNQIAVQED